MLRLLNWILHGLTGCPERNKYQFMYGSIHCKSCGRVNFIGDEFPKFERFVSPKPRIKDIV